VTDTAFETAAQPRQSGGAAHTSGYKKNPKQTANKNPSLRKVLSVLRKKSIVVSQRLVSEWKIEVWHEP